MYLYVYVLDNNQSECGKSSFKILRYFRAIVVMCSWRRALCHFQRLVGRSRSVPSRASTTSRSLFILVVVVFFFFFFVFCYDDAANTTKSLRVGSSPCVAATQGSCVGLRTLPGPPHSFFSLLHSPIVSAGNVHHARSPFLASLPLFILPRAPMIFLALGSLTLPLRHSPSLAHQAVSCLSIIHRVAK